ncbi:MAG: response regulator [Bacteroidales bacterium]|nr:response regulator [Bacteroidales bacterium]
MKPLIFVVDDDVFFIKYISTLLCSNSFDNIKSFSDGEKLIANLHHYPDLILLDHDMEGMSGREVLKYLQQNKFDIPVVMVSGREEEELINEVYTLGVRKYFIKDEFLFRNLKDFLNSSLQIASGF